MISARGLLSHVPLYVGLQKAVGADRLRYRCIDEIAIQPGEVVLDVGCGPAYYFDRLPQPITYHGFDTDAGYIAWAQKRWGPAATFHCGVFDQASAESLPSFDAVLLLGLLHHLSDEQVTDLLTLTASVLQPNGRVVSVDTCFEPTQGRISRWMSENDRGEHVRAPEAFEALAQAHFGEVKGSVVNDLTRIPGSHWLMHLRGPIAVSSP